MIATLLVLAASLSAQVDEDYDPKVGDRAAVGTHITQGRPPSPREYVTHASCFSTQEALRLALEAADEGGLVKSYPDSYHPRPAAAVEVLGFAAVKYRHKGEEEELRAVKVKVLEGEFQGRTFYVQPWNVLKLTGRVGARRARRGGVPAAGAGAKIVLNDLVVESNEFTGMSSIAGRFRNVSQEDLESLRVEISIEDASGKLLKSVTAFCQPNEIAAGGAASFKTIVETEPRAASIKLEFLDLRKAVPWTDKSGKNAHP